MSLLPDLSWPPAARFWGGVAAGELRMPRCEGCERLVWYPQPACPRCASTSMRWDRLSGTGTLFTWVVVRRALVPELADRVPMVLGLLSLDEDPSVRLAAELSLDAGATPTIGMALSTAFRAVPVPGTGEQLTVPVLVKGRPG